MSLSSTEIKVKLLRKGVSMRDLSNRWNIPQENISRVIHRTSGFVFPKIRKLLAEFLEVSVSAVGRESIRKINPKTRFHKVDNTLEI